VIRTLIIDPGAPARLGFTTVEPPTPAATEVLVRVKAISLNRGEVLYQARGEAGTRLGRDLAGVVERPAAQGGPSRGARVVAFVADGAWAEQVAVPANAVVELPPSVSFAQAAALPTAGLTALAAIGHGDDLLERAVLVTGASGGVGLIACRLATLAGGRVVGQIRQAESAPLVHDTGVAHVVIDDNLAATAPFGPYHLIADVVGGEPLAEVMTQLAPGGTCVSIGPPTPANSLVQVDLGRMRQAPGACLYFLNIGRELQKEPPSRGLQRLVRLVSDGQLTPHLGVEADWSEIATVAQGLIDREFQGKAVLHLPDR
jgi:NADPH:quinone reductase-like Zn-dependent oxidoreductase